MRDSASHMTHFSNTPSLATASDAPGYVAPFDASTARLGLALDVPDTIATLFDFPCADDLAAAAALFPQDVLTSVSGYGWTVTGLDDEAFNRHTQRYEQSPSSWS